MVCNFFDKKSSGSGIINEPNYPLANELHKPIIKEFKKRFKNLQFRGRTNVISDLNGKEITGSFYEK